MGNEDRVLGLFNTREPNMREEEFLIQDQAFNQGWPVKITMRHYIGLGGRPGWSEIWAEQDNEPKKMIAGCSLEFLREVVKLADERRKIK